MAVNPEYLEVAAGKLFFFSSGEYSDYGVSGHFLALGDLNLAEFEAAGKRIVDRVRSDETHTYRNEMDDSWYRAVVIHDGLIAELIRSGMIMILDCPEINVGGYGSSDQMLDVMNPDND